MPSKAAVALQMELASVLWGIFGMLAYIAHLLGAGWAPIVLAFLCFIIAFVYLVASIIQSKRKKENV